MIHRRLPGIALALLLGSVARADIGVLDGKLFEMKVLSQNEKEVTLIPAHCDATAAEKWSTTALTRIIMTDEHGGVITDSGAPKTPPPEKLVEADPVAPPVTAPPGGNSYYLIPLHGEVGETVLASALQRSLEDAIRRKPTVVVLDVDSPGGTVQEATDIVKILHTYNKKLRIVALVDQDLSAAAVFTLSVKEIYVKPAGTIGAATPYVLSNGAMPATLEEKMQSAWRAVARNSAEEGGHEPLLADAMIENDLELHWERIQGKPVVKEGVGSNMILRKGRVLTLTGHEAVNCGLAAGRVDDIEELGQALHMESWKPIRGLGTALAEVLPKRAAKYKAEMEAVRVRLKADLAEVVENDPSRSGEMVTRIVTVPSRTMVPIGPRPINPSGPMNGPLPMRPGIRVVMPMVPGPPTRQVITERQKRDPVEWAIDSLKCVVAFHKVERDLRDAIALSKAFDRTTEAEVMESLLSELSTVRGQVWDERNKHMDKILPPGVLRTGVAGDRSSGDYRVTTNSEFHPVLGFKYVFMDRTLAQIPVDFSPVYARDVISPADSIIAKEGYVVSGIQVDASPGRVFAVRVIFSAWQNGDVDPRDSYMSEWIGTPTGRDPVQFGSKAHTALGVNAVYGLYNRMTALGLVVREPKEGK